MLTSLEHWLLSLFSPRKPEPRVRSEPQVDSREDVRIWL